ncbi:T9SS type A sorting domain-containing protein [Bizionia sp. KMM 8389]
MKKNYNLFLLTVLCAFGLNAQTVITQSVDPVNVTDGGVACWNSTVGTFSENSFMRSYDMSDFSITEDFGVTSVEFGQSSADEGKVVTLNLYTASSENLGFASLTLLASTTHVCTAADNSSVVSVPLTATIPAGSIIAFEVLAGSSGDNINETFFPGVNDAGENAPSYLIGSDCSITTPTTTASIGFPDNQYLLNVVGDVLSVDSFSLKNISVSPNPAQDYVNISFPKSISEFTSELYDIAGKVVLKSNNTENLDISKLQSGVYILKITTETGSVTKRVIKS